MKLRDLKNIVFDKVVIYKAEGDGFVDIYKGELSKAKVELLDHEVSCVGAKRKGILDIQVK